MPRQSQLDSARLRRDLGLARARRLTVYTAVGAIVFTGVFALVAAASFPGRSPASTPATQPGSTGKGGVTQPGLTAPIQQPVNGGAPTAVSGGS